MKEYKVVKTGEKQAEAVMNDMAKDGWRVAAVTYDSYWTISLLITLERER